MKMGRPRGGRKTRRWVGMEFDTLDYLHLLRLGAWVRAFIDAAVAIGTWRFFARRAAIDRPGRPVGVGPMVIALLAAGVTCGAKAIAPLLLMRDLFGVVRVLYLGIAVAPAALGAWVLGSAIPASRARPDPLLNPTAATASRRSTAALTLALLLFVPVPVCAYASFVAPFQLVTERHEVALPRLATSVAPIRVGVLADLQTDAVTDYEYSAIDRLLAEKPDLILLPGDFFQASWRQWQERGASYRKLIERLDAPFGCYAVCGDVDDPDDLSQLLAGTRVRLLANDIATVSVRGTNLAIGGVELHPRTAGSLATIRRLAATPCDLRLLVAHRPDVALDLTPADGVDLFVAGHTHGGQIVIPGFGPPVTLTHVPRRIAAGGLHDLNGQPVYISRGVGHERGSAPPMRLFCPPEISILTLMGGHTTENPTASAQQSLPP